LSFEQRIDPGTAFDVLNNAVVEITKTQNQDIFDVVIKFIDPLDPNNFYIIEATYDIKKEGFVEKDNNLEFENFMPKLLLLKKEGRGSWTKLKNGDIFLYKMSGETKLGFNADIYLRIPRTGDTVEVSFVGGISLKNLSERLNSSNFRQEDMTDDKEVKDDQVEIYKETLNFLANENVFQNAKSLLDYKGAGSWIKLKNGTTLISKSARKTYEIITSSGYGLEFIYDEVDKNPTGRFKVFNIKNPDILNANLECTSEMADDFMKLLQNLPVINSNYSPIKILISRGPGSWIEIQKGVYLAFLSKNAKKPLGVFNYHLFKIFSNNFPSNGVVFYFDKSVSDAYAEPGNILDLKPDNKVE
jgi:hypothetical protein